MNVYHQVLTASIGYYLIDSFTLIGASGGIYCLISACISDILMNWKESRAIFVTRCRGGQIAHATDGKFLRIFRLSAVVAFVLFDLVYVLSVAPPGVSVWAHVFGSIAGVMFGLVWLKDQNEEAWERWLKIISGVAFAFMLAVAIGLNIAGFNNVI